MKRFLYGVGLGAVLLGAGFIAAGITITPSSHDYGKVAVRAWGYASFAVSIPTGAGARDTLTVMKTGADTADFDATDDGGCPALWRRGWCNYVVAFRPKSLGPKTANLFVTDTRGNRATLQLKGEGVEPVCTNEWVFCNYAHLYSGTFGWTSGLAGPGSQYNEHVQVDIVNGVAMCNGAATSTSQGTSRTGAIHGNGIAAIQFVNDSAGKLVYRITVACPTPAWPAGSNGEPATPSERAELGHNDQQSYDQPATAPAMDLIGSRSNPAPETDQLNGVTGNVVVRWALCNPARYKVPAGGTHPVCT
jgi:hypothetical protein